ncbi:MAG: SBBP repeat-containing protein [Bacteroidetes bacterium]|nr:SBBP repeat-containing protein [Bacteroidota bacterium]
MKRIYLFILVFILMSNFFANNDKARHVSAEKERSQIAQNLLGSGLRFTPNKGQIADRNGRLRPDVLYKGEGNGSNIYLRKTGISYVFSNMAEVMYEVHEKVEEIEHSKEGLGGKTEGEWEQELVQKESIKVYQVDMDFINCNANIKAIDEDEIAGYNNYYYAHCPDGVLNVKQYNKVTCKNVYNGIDVSYYACPEQGRRGSSEKGLKYDLIVQPHADPNQIKLHWKGAESIHINREGNGSTGLTTSLVIKTSVNEFIESIPKVYQNINGKIVDVKTKYVLTHISEGEAIINFLFSTFNSSLPLVIDPWVTYYGGTGVDYGNRIATDASGNVYMTGSTYSTAGIASAGSFQNIYDGGGDAFLVKFNGAGARLWATYYGGTGTDYGNSVATDASGNVYLTGQTNSTAGIAAGGFQNILGGFNDAFLVKFNSAGVRDWATYYGGTETDYGNSVTTDASGNVYLAGQTRSTAGIASAGSFQNILGGFNDAFLVKFNSAGVCDWATYYGGTEPDYGYGVTTDGAGNIYMTGGTNSTSGIAAGGFQNVFGGIQDAYLVKFNGAGNRLWATYYGGTSSDQGRSVATDASGNVYMAGFTFSTAGIAAGGFQNVFGGIQDAYLVKFNGAGSRLWASYLGGTDQDYARSVAVDQLTNDVYVSGDTYSTNFPTTACAWQQNLAGGISEDGFVTHFKPDGSLVCSSYVGGSAVPNDEECTIALYGCYVYMTGYTGGSYPVTPGAHQTVYGGGPFDAFVAQLYKNSCGFDKIATLAASASASAVCNNIPINFTGNFSVSCDNSVVSYSWSFPGGGPAASGNQNPTGIVYATPGNYTAQLKAKTTCDSAVKDINITINPCTVCNLVGQFTKGTANCAGCGCKEWIMINATGGTNPYIYTWPDGYDKRYKNQLCPGNYTIKIKDKNGCSIDVNLSAP